MKFQSKNMPSSFITIGRILIPILLVAAMALVFALRYTPAFEIPNFYAEDGKVFADNSLHNNSLKTMFTAFNGYLITGLYILVELSVAVYSLLDLKLYQLPMVMAAVSCIFLGLTVSLPYILLRKQLGIIAALLTVVFGALVAIPSFDYAIIGTIGNLKFLFLYWAFLFCLYRNYNAENKAKVIVADIILLLCVLTYAPAVFLLLFALWPYRIRIMQLFKTRKIAAIMTVPMMSLVALLFVSALYMLAVYLNGIPKIPGYLDTPFDPASSLKLAYRSTWYAWLFPISPTMRDMVTLGLLGVTAFYGLIKPANRFITIFALWSIAIATVSFAANRPGISDYFLAYGPNPDQFFYAQTLIFMFLTIWIARGVMIRDLQNILVTIALSTIFIWWSLEATGSFGRNRVIYEHLGTAKENVQLACAQPGEKVSIQSYPTSEWKWNLERSIACD